MNIFKLVNLLSTKVVVHFSHEMRLGIKKNFYLTNKVIMDEFFDDVGLTFSEVENKLFRNNLFSKLINNPFEDSYVMRPKQTYWYIGNSGFLSSIGFDRTEIEKSYKAFARAIIASVTEEFIASLIKKVEFFPSHGVHKTADGDEFFCIYDHRLCEIHDIDFLNVDRMVDKLMNTPYSKSSLAKFIVAHFKIKAEDLIDIYAPDTKDEITDYY